MKLMKKVVYLLALAACIFTACEKTPDPIAVSFEKGQYVLLADASTEITVTLSSAAEKAVSIPLTFSGEAVKDQDYTVSSETVSIAAGATSGSITVTPKDNYSEKTIQVGFYQIPDGYVAGNYTTANVAVEAKTVLLYSFNSTKYDVLDKTVIKVDIQAMGSLTEFAATEDIDLPYKVEGAADAIEIVENAIKIKKGSNYGTLTVIAKDLALDAAAAKVTISVDAEKAGPRFAPGTNVSTELTVKGVLKISSLLGTWNFGGTYGSDPDFELEMWFEEMEDDSSLLPLDNAGFTLTFAEEKDENGNVTGYKIIPGGEGSFNNFYRESSITWTAPIADNLTTPGEIISDFCSQELNMFVAEYDPNIESDEFLTWFSVNANRSFDNTNESLGTAAIAMRVGADGELVIHIKDYDQPPFGEMWWDGYDPDMFAFASWFTRAE